MSTVNQAIAKTISDLRLKTFICQEELCRYCRQLLALKAEQRAVSECNTADGGGNNCDVTDRDCTDG